MSNSIQYDVIIQTDQHHQLWSTSSIPDDTVAVAPEMMLQFSGIMNKMVIQQVLAVYQLNDQSLYSLSKEHPHEYYGFNTMVRSVCRDDFRHDIENLDLQHVQCAYDICILTFLKAACNYYCTEHTRTVEWTFESSHCGERQKYRKRNAFLLFSVPNIEQPVHNSHAYALRNPFLHRFTVTTLSIQCVSLPAWFAFRMS